jgi:transketolase
MPEDSLHQDIAAKAEKGCGGFALANCIRAVSIDAVEDAGKLGWTRHARSEDDVIGLDGFGASGPAEELCRSFGITRDAITARAEMRLGNGRDR